MDQFFTAVKNLLERLGVKNVDYPYEGAYYIVVAGCRYSAYRKRHNGTTVEVDNKKFSLKTGSSLLAAHIIETLPSKLEKKKKEDEQEKLKQEARTINQCVQDINISVYVGGNNYEEFKMEYTHKDKATMMAAIDYLQEGGFCSPDPDIIKDQTFMLNQIRRMWKNLSEESRKQFLGDVEQLV